MTPQQINDSVAAGRVYLTRSEQLAYRLNFVLWCVPLAFFVFLLSDQSAGRGEIFICGVISLLLFLWWLRYKINAPKLTAYRAKLTPEQFQTANQAAADTRDWRVITDTPEYFSAIQLSMQQNEGIKITAILQNEKVYLNSMAAPSLWANPFSFRVHKKNKAALLQRYREILRGEDVLKNVRTEAAEREAEFWNTSESSPKIMFQRIIGYSISLLFIGGSIYILMTATESELLAVALIGAVISGYCLSYIIADIRVIREKRKRKQ